MAIKNVPKIVGPDYGGVIYGLNLSIGYSTEPSKLTIDIVNQNGVYSLPALNSSEQIKFSNFTFNGIVWSYNIKESAGEKILQVTFVDNSIILDRYYVLLWKRGLLGLPGTKKTRKKTFNFSDETIIVPVKAQTLSGFGYTKFDDRRLGNVSIDANSYSLGSSRVGNVILVGHEKFANSACDIPDTYYTFNDLKGQIPVNMSSAPNNSTWKATHEGSLREVLSSWCSDLGFDYYWNFSSNTLNFYDVSRGIATIPDITASNIISKDQSASMAGTYRHYGIGYTAIPKSPVKTISFSRSIVILYSASAYPISYFINKIGVVQKINQDSGKWGGNRNQNDFIHAGFLGYVCRSLRDLFCFQNEHWEALGYKVNSNVSANKSQLINLLKNKLNYEAIGDLESFDAKNLPNYDFTFLSRDPTIADKWFEKEKELLQYIGKYYRSSDSSGSFFYCNANYTIEIEISVDPEGQVLEGDSLDFAGRKVIDRGGSMSHDETKIKEALGYDKLITQIQNCAPIHIDLKESGILDTLLSAKILSKDQAKDINTLVIYPNSSKFVKTKLGFTSSLSNGTHPLEKTVTDIKNANISSGRKNCKEYEKNLEKGSCKQAEETARDIAIKNAGGIINSTENQDDFISGLLTKTARSCRITLLNSGGVTFFAPSDDPLQVVCRYTININKINTTDTDQFLWSVGSPGIADDVAEIRVSNENITDPDEDSYQKRRPGVLIKPADSVCATPQQEIKYVFAGEPENINLNPGNGLSNLDISLSSDGFTTSATFSTKPPKPSKPNNMVRHVQSQFNRASYNAS
jgi:hypothetical protein